MRLVDADSLLKKWNEMPLRSRCDFDQVIVMEQTVPAIRIIDNRKHSCKIVIEEEEE